MGAPRHNSLTAKQETAIAALISEPTVDKAADAVGVNRRTLYRWLDEPAFTAKFHKARRQTFTHAVSMAQKYAPMALNNLAVIANDKTAPHSARVSASKAVLDFGRESLELDDLATRLAALEAAAAQDDKNKDGDRR
jgi:pyocin large subunit-like protein